MAKTKLKTPKTDHETTETASSSAAVDESVVDAVTPPVGASEPEQADTLPPEAPSPASVTVVAPEPPLKGHEVLELGHFAKGGMLHSIQEGTFLAIDHEHAAELAIAIDAGMLRVRRVY